ncbi:LLM class F420-dependent oxidoreductase [Mycobacterium sp. IS-1496]|uniref:TIGR03619 family F420-dependent LLM class oxidoreductase n=1 Tax=Mycobacterium sp. IS-1496 TaxID=1772284 RepID=UPI0007417AC3|nr:TIGR03619 family F420-dependent LLM class oxidoreductase [Mycobacterium sp. IS-1496]KUI35215.1 LLM class F420-dependent oxidoreductase [Mycobacterium sp. IS-1496]
MYIGFVSMNTPADIAPGVLAVELEQRGFESLWVGEHPQIPVSAAGSMPAALLHAQQRIWDPLLSLLAAAQNTSTLRLGTAVALPLEHELFTFAKQVATLDQFSDGRVVLGIGVGVRAELAVTSPIAWADRYKALTDMVAALHTLWTQDEAEHHGEFFDFEPVWCHPKPAQRPGPPLLAAATGPKAIGECLPWADGWLPGDAAYRDLPAAVAEFRRRAEEAGRNPAELDLTVMAWGDPSANRLARYRDLGFNRVVVGGGRRNGDDVASSWEFLDRYAELATELR